MLCKVLHNDLSMPTCIFEGSHDGQQCILEHSRTACRVPYTHKSNTAFLVRFLWIIIFKMTYSMCSSIADDCCLADIYSS